jgi:site-specific DNA-methyltransferase (adenine-specific)
MSAPEQGQLPLGGGVASERPAAPTPAVAAPEADTFSKADAFVFLHSLDTASVDLVITDPPYSSLELHRSRGTTTRLVGNWFETLANERLPDLLREVYRVLKPDRHFYLFCDEYIADVVKAQQGVGEVRERDGSRECVSGFHFWRELIWLKTTQDGTRPHAGMGYHYRSASERILFFEKGKRKLNDLGVPDVLMAPRADNGAPAAKPLGVVTTLVAQSTLAGERVVDPFAGSGVVGQAAMNLDRRFLLNDLDDSYLLPEVAKKAMPYRGRFLLVLPRCPSPEHFLEQIIDHEVNGARLSAPVAHDLDTLAMVEGAGREVVAKLATTRDVERPATLRRYLRSLPWIQEAMGRTEDRQRYPILKTWLEWIER